MSRTARRSRVHRKWNDGDLTRSAWRARRLRATHEEAAGAVLAGEGLAGAAFAAACAAALQRGELAVGERFTAGALWSERDTGHELFDAPAQVTHGYVTRLDEAARRCQVVLVHPELAVGRLELEVVGAGAQTAVRLELVYTALRAAGNALLENAAGPRMQALLQDTARRFVDACRATAPAAPSAGRSARRRASTGASVLVQGCRPEHFRLACPVAELAWIDDWRFDLVYSDSGRNELDCLFCEGQSGLAVQRMLGVDTFWYTTRFDPDALHFDAVLVTGNRLLGRWEFSVEPLGEGVARWDLRATFTGLGEEGDRIVGEPGYQARMQAMLRFVLGSAKHYVETGRVYRLPHRKKVELALSLLGAAIGRHVRRLRAVER